MWLAILVSVTIINVEGKVIRSELNGPGWQDLLSVGGMHIDRGRMKRYVELSKNQTDVPYQACILPNGRTGHCRHVQHCIQDEFKTDFLKFMDYMCIIDRTYIGACCPDKPNEDRIKDGLVEGLPAMASNEVDNRILFRDRRAEKRGCGVSTRHYGAQALNASNHHDWPWMASIGIKNANAPRNHRTHYCGGTIITDRHILTAAHCAASNPEELYTRLGEYDYKRLNESRYFDFNVTDIRRHEEYDSSNRRHDIAILKLHRNVIFSSYIWPICLPPAGLNYVNRTVSITGWGTVSFGGPRSHILKEVTVPVWDIEKCRDSLTDTVFDENMCAAAYEGGKDACQFDSGGPVMHQMDSGRWTVVGIVSWGIRCGEKEHPGVHLRVDKYLDWIYQNTYD